MDRREFLLSGVALMSARTSSATSARIDILPDEVIGTITPDIYGHFTEHLGGCIYDGVRGTDAQIGGPLGARGGRDGDPDIGVGREPGGNISVQPAVTVRWESALPIRQAVQRLGEEPLGADELYYAVAIIGLPAFTLNGDLQELKTNVYLKHGKKKIAPADVKVVMRDGNPVLVLLFPRTGEITVADKELEVSVRIADLEIKQRFVLKQMTSNGKLEL